MSLDWPGLFDQLVGRATTSRSIRPTPRSARSSPATRRRRRSARSCLACNTTASPPRSSPGVVRTMLDACEGFTVDAGRDRHLRHRRLDAAPPRAFNVSTLAAFVVAGAGGRCASTATARRRPPAARPTCSRRSACTSISTARAWRAASTRPASASARAALPPRHAPRRPGPARARHPHHVQLPRSARQPGRRQAPGRRRGRRSMASTVARVLLGNGAERAMVVFGHDGLDELTATGPSTVLELRDGLVVEHAIDPGQYGLQGAQRGARRRRHRRQRRRWRRRCSAARPDRTATSSCSTPAPGLVVAGVVDDIGDGVKLAAATRSTTAPRPAVLEKLVATVERLVDEAQRDGGRDAARGAGRDRRWPAPTRPRSTTASTMSDSRRHRDVRVDSRVRHDDLGCRRDSPMTITLPRPTPIGEALRGHEAALEQETANRSARSRSPSPAACRSGGVGRAPTARAPRRCRRRRPRCRCRGRSVEVDDAVDECEALVGEIGDHDALPCRWRHRPD